MIDVENIVYSKVRMAVKSKYPKAFTESTYVNRASSFPCVSLVEMDNAIYRKTQDLSGRENHAELVYECNIYTEGTGRKQQAKAIAKIVDDTMSAMNFTRIFAHPTPNIERTIFRYTLRFIGIASEGVKVGDNTVFQIYNK